MPIRATALAVALGAFASGCGGGPTPNAGNSQAPKTKPTQAQTPTKARTTHAGGTRSASVRNLSAADFSPKLFGKPTSTANRLLPFKPGTQWVRQGFVNVGTRRLPHQVTTTVADVSKTVDGVRTVAVLDQDTNGGQIAEQSIDWTATDRYGNVWYLGSYTESYAGGQFVTANDAWLGGANGAKPGILMLADPHVGTAPFTEDTVPGIEAPTAQVDATGLRQCVPFKCYSGVVSIREGGEHKYFAPGVGQISTTPPAGGGAQEVEKLVNLRRLTPGGVRQISNLVLSLDKHARTAAATVFGQSQPATRGGFSRAFHLGS